jgi:hypothetical protein
LIFTSEPIEALFKIAGCLEPDNPLFEPCERLTDRSSMLAEDLAHGFD